MMSSYPTCDYCHKSYIYTGNYHSCDCGKSFCTECDVYLSRCGESDNEEFDKGDIMECSYCIDDPQIPLNKDKKYNCISKKI